MSVFDDVKRTTIKDMMATGAFAPLSPSLRKRRKEIFGMQQKRADTEGKARFSSDLAAANRKRVRSEKEAADGQQTDSLLEKLKKMKLLGGTP